MNVEEIKDKKEWENFLSLITEKTFLQSWNWGEFQTKQGHKVWRLGLKNGTKLLATALVSKIKAKRGTYLLIQHGPMILEDIDNTKKFEILEIFLKEIAKIGNQEKASFIRINPLWERNENNGQVFQQLGLRKAPMHANAYEATWKLDIRPTEEELLKQMRKTTRYLIRQAEKNLDISFEMSESADSLPSYQILNQAVAERQHFVPFSDRYIQNEFEAFIKDKQVALFFGKYKNEIAAGALIIFWQGIGFYHQAASLQKFSKFSIPYLLQWEIIKEAKRRGCFLYDFWGYVDPQKEPSHPWAGPTLFKMGFGGNVKQYMQTQDYILSPLYWFTYLLEQIRRKKRNL
jgi:lipid II:glycine glycyltransferase (peptidoglycan interpeptide bridge formation enzyme)